jgi:hypothetical protein
MKFECLLDGHKWESTSRSLQRGGRCPKCSDNARYTQQSFTERHLKELPEVVVHDYNEFKNFQTKMHLTCINRHDWYATPGHMFHSKGKCKACYGLKLKTEEEFLKDLREVHENIVPIEKYIGNDKKILFTCKINGNIWGAKPDNILSGQGCPKCAKNGYKVHKPAQLYTYIVDGDTICFGITNNPYHRHIVHRRNFKQFGVDFKLDVCYYGSGQKMLDAENLIKHKYTITPLDVPGFVTESISVDDYKSFHRDVEELLNG